MRLPVIAAVAIAALLFHTDGRADPTQEFHDARAAVLVRVLESTYPSPAVTAKLLVLRSWKGPFPVGTTITAYATEVCAGACIPTYPFQVGQEVLVFLYEEVGPGHIFVYPNAVIDGDHGVRVDDAIRMLDAAAAKTGT
jgi:hypothetical protein